MTPYTANQDLYRQMERLTGTPLYASRRKMTEIIEKLLKHGKRVKG